jgi:predicted nuclease with TOPRIM domain
MSNIIVKNHFQPANLPGISFDVSKIKGKFDPDVQEKCEAALTSLKESQRLYNVAVGAVRERLVMVLNAEWSEMQECGRKLEDKLNRKREIANRSDNLFRSYENTLRSATLALNKVNATTLPKRPTVEEISKRDAEIASAKSAVNAAKQAQSGFAANHQKTAGELRELQTEYSEFEAKERALAHKFKSVLGHFPEHYIDPVEAAQKQAKGDAQQQYDADRQLAMQNARGGLGGLGLASF